MSSESDAKAQEEHVPEGDIIYRAIRNDGDHALGMTNAALMWSGLAAGLSMGFSLAAEGVLRAQLPEAPWRPLVAKLGYAVGFLIVILGRQQLFTEQTLTAMLSLFAVDRREGTIGNIARLWAIVLLANLVGSAFFAFAAAWTPVFTPEVRAAFAQIGHEALNPGFVANFVRGIYAGFLIATMVWLLPGSGESRM
jgi:formate/nitrite transporter FocA (FNT family)